MDTKIVKEEQKLYVKIIDRLDAGTTPQLEEKILPFLEETKELCFDLEDLVYISSAGLRILLKCKKIMDEKGTMKVENVNGQVKEIFEVSGFDQIFETK